MTYKITEKLHIWFPSQYSKLEYDCYHFGDKRELDFIIIRKIYKDDYHIYFQIT